MNPMQEDGVWGNPEGSQQRCVHSMHPQRSLWPHQLFSVLGKAQTADRWAAVAQLPAFLLTPWKGQVVLTEQY